MGKLKNYKKYLIEKSSYLKDKIESFNSNIDSIGIPNSLKKISNELNDDIIEVPSIKIINYMGYEFHFNIKYGTYDGSAINFIDLIYNKSNIINMNVSVTKNYDRDYLNSIIIHELRHVYDFLDENQSADTSSFIIDMNRKQFNIPKYFDFMKLIYISLEHELVARNNQIYPYIKFKNLSKEDSVNILKTSFIWTSLNELNTFNVNSFIKKFNLSELIIITNNFIELCLGDENYKTNNLKDIKNFYNIWNKYFIKTSNKWKQELLSEVNKLYEKNHYEILDNNIPYKILNSIWQEIKSSHF